VLNNELCTRAEVFTGRGEKKNSARAHLIFGLRGGGERGESRDGVKTKKPWRPAAGREKAARIDDRKQASRSKEREGGKEFGKMWSQGSDSEKSEKTLRGRAKDGKVLLHIGTAQ